jgi:PhnB protein
MKVNTYLNFAGDAEEAFNFYSRVFGVPVGPLMRMGEMATDPTSPSLSETEKNFVMHTTLTLPGGHVLMATDMLPSLGHHLRVGNNTTISLEPDSKEEADRLYGLLSEGGSEGSGMISMPFGYWGSCLDRFQVPWMINYVEV